MNFGEALEALKEGKRCARKGWNGKGMFIYFVESSIVKHRELRSSVKFHLPAGENENVVINSHIDMKTADGSICVGWLVSQTDMLANDWEVL